MYQCTTMYIYMDLTPWPHHELTLKFKSKTATCPVSWTDIPDLSLLPANWYLPSHVSYHPPVYHNVSVSPQRKVTLAELYCSNPSTVIPTQLKEMFLGPEQATLSLPHQQDHLSCPSSRISKPSGYEPRFQDVQDRGNFLVTLESDC